MDVVEKHELNPILKLLAESNQYHYRNGKNMKAFLGEQFDTYKKGLERAIEEDTFIDASFVDELKQKIPSIKETTNNILKIIDLYEKDKLIEAERLVRKVLFDNKSNMIIRTLSRDRERSMYRIRPGDNYPMRRKELFHVPMSKKAICKEGRFSKNGVPCLYLATQLPLSWIEMDKPEICRAARFEISENCLTPISVIDMSGKQISDAYQIFGDIINYKNKGKDLTNIYEYLLKAICIIPIRLAITIPVEGQENKQEYYFSQVLLEWIKNNKIADGIVYETCKSEEAWAYFGYNIALFVNDVDDEGYDKNLQSVFTISKPKELKKIERADNLLGEGFDEMKMLVED